MLIRQKRVYQPHNIVTWQNDVLRHRFETVPHADMILLIENYNYVVLIGAAITYEYLLCGIKEHE